MIACFDVTIPAPHGGGPVVDKLSLKMEKGSWNEIVGPAGAGKSALFDVLTLRRRPASGRLIIGGRNIERLGRRALSVARREMGSCPQHPTLLMERTALENVLLPLVVRGATQGAVEAAEEALGFLGLMPERDRSVSTLCAQQQALVGLAMAAVGRPKVVIIDGVHEGLEAATRGMALSWLERAQGRGSTIVVFGRRAMNRRAASVLWRLRDGDVERTGEVDRC